LLSLSLSLFYKYPKITTRKKCKKNYREEEEEEEEGTTSCDATMKIFASLILINVCLTLDV
jgi:hypothetical protein